MQMINGDNPSLSSRISGIASSDLEAVNISNTGMLFYFVLSGMKATNLLIPQPFTNEFYTYINFVVSYRDEYAKLKEFAVRPCTRQDFLDVGAEDIYDSKYPNYEQKKLLICIDDPNHEIKLKGNQVGTLGSSLANILMTSCDKKKYQCKSRQEVEAFMKSFAV